MSKSSTGIRISSEVDSKQLRESAEAIARVLSSAADSHADQETVRKALDTLARFGGVSGTSIAGCNIAMGTRDD